MIRVILTADTAPMLQLMIDEYMKEYHPAGYGTTVDRKWEDADGFHADVSRYYSCD
jgi:hypothetical protein